MPSSKARPRLVEKADRGTSKALSRLKNWLRGRPPSLQLGAQEPTRVKLPSTAQRFETTLGIADQLVGRGNAQHALLALCRMVARSVQYDQMALSLARTDSAPALLGDFQAMARRLKIKEQEAHGEPIWLGWDAVVTTPWEPTRMADILRRLSCGPGGAEGPDQKPWRYDWKNHVTTLWLPMRVAEAFNGLHSISAGLLSSTGTLPVDYIRDLTPAYGVFTATTEEWHRTDTGEVFRVADWRTALLFELGRRLTPHPPLNLARGEEQASKPDAWSLWNALRARLEELPPNEAEALLDELKTFVYFRDFNA